MKPPKNGAMAIIFHSTPQKCFCFTVHYMVNEMGPLKHVAASGRGSRGILILDSWHSHGTCHKFHMLELQ